jgi:alkylhydroperoxidase/carboxymuconolactone decarboxylase family protein YurZ
VLDEMRVIAAEQQAGMGSRRFPTLAEGAILGPTRPKNRSFSKASPVMAIDDLPPFVREVVAKHPDVWTAFNQLGERVAQAGPLDARTQRLMKLAISVGAGLQGAVHSHVRRAVAEGIDAASIRHVALLAITTVGWPAAIARLSWIEDILSEKSNGAPRA